MTTVIVVTSRKQSRLPNESFGEFILMTDIFTHTHTHGYEAQLATANNQCVIHACNRLMQWENFVYLNPSNSTYERWLIYETNLVVMSEKA